MRVKEYKYNKAYKKDKRYIPGEYDIREREDAGEPTRDKSEETTILNSMAFKDLAYSKPITVQANPSAEATRAAVPYSIINSTNKVYDAKYPGENNFAGNTMPLLNNSVKSKLLNMFDIGKMDIVVKYLYAAIRPTDINQALNVQLGKSMSEALSKAFSETYIQMPFFLDSIESDMINCDPENRTQAFIWYQTMLQNIAHIPGKYNLLISLEQHLKDMSYNRNVAPLDDLFGLLRKNSFRAKIKAFSNTITGEYFDLSWFKQVNTLTMVPSRKTNSMQDPLLVIDAIHDIPSIKITSASGTEIFSSDDYNVTLPDSIPGSTRTVSFQVAINTLIRLLSPYNVIQWARQYTEGAITTDPTTYFNTIVDMTEVIRAKLSRFPSDVSDMRAVLDVANRAGLNRWKRGVYFDVTKEMNYSPVFNKLVNDVFVSYLACANTISYDTTTLRWKFFTIWDKYLGIPQFDKVNGGSFLTFSTRSFPASVTPSTDTQFLIPKLFDIPSTGYSTIAMCNRNGLFVEIGFKIYSNNTLNNDDVFCRLNPLSYTDMDLRVPSVNITEIVDNPQVSSALIQCINNLFGFGEVEISEGVFNKTLSSDKICAIDVELDDVSNGMIAFAQAYAPFKVYTPTKERTIGFSELPSV